MKEARVASGLVEFASGIPDFRAREGRYEVRFARTDAEVRSALRLRYEVFNVELGEGLAESRATGLDRDHLDDQCHHLLVEDAASVETVGTYRMQTPEMARQALGLYTDREYDLAGWGEPEALEASVEIGRAGIARRHRHGLVLLLLWKGLGAYANHHGKRSFFGCCSLTSQDPREGLRAMEWLRRRGHVHPALCAPARPGFACHGTAADREGWEDVTLPKLFRTYLRYGARIASEPAIDREFGTMDYLALLEMGRLDPDRILRHFAEYVRRGA